MAVTEMVPDLIWAPDFFGPQEICSQYESASMFHAGTKFPGAQKSGAQMI